MPNEIFTSIQGWRMSPNSFIIIEDCSLGSPILGTSIGICYLYIVWITVAFVSSSQIFKGENGRMKRGVFYHLANGSRKIRIIIIRLQPLPYPLTFFFFTEFAVALFSDNVQPLILTVINVTRLHLFMGHCSVV